VTQPKKSTVVVKFGGHAMSDEHGGFAEAIHSAQGQGVQIVVVHGGGPQINRALERAGIASHFLGGFRVTDQETFSVVEEVLTKQVGPHVSENLNSHGVESVSISGRSNSLLIATPQRNLVDGTPVDLGLVGIVSAVNAEPINTLLSQGIVPVIAPIALSIDGATGLNVNADLAAAAIAGELDADSLIIMTDVPGIYRNWPDTGSLINEISSSELSSIKDTFAEGMAPKVQATLDAISNGAKAVRIIDGRDPSALMHALMGSGGTLVTK
jgi:acetylglutamate kinase